MAQFESIAYKPGILMNNETYYLSSLDSNLFAPTRKCKVIRRMEFTSGKECLLVHLSPAVIGQNFNLGEDVSEFVLTSRHEAGSLSQVTTFPLFVYIARPVREIGESQIITKDDIEVVAWGELYRNQNDAEQHVFDN